MTRSGGRTTGLRQGTLAVVPWSDLLESIGLDAGDELHRRRADLIAQESVDVQRHRGVDAIYRRQRAERYAMPLQAATGRDDRLAAGRTVPRPPIQIVQVPGTVHAQPDEEPAFSQERAPRVAQQRAIGLQ